MFSSTQNNLDWQEKQSFNASILEDYLSPNNNGKPGAVRYCENKNEKINEEICLEQF